LPGKEVSRQRGRRATIIAKLRRKLERSPAEPAYIITVHKVGYKFLG
jgi:DNA-binding response OmpR family regulator